MARYYVNSCWLMTFSKHLKVRVAGIEGSTGSQKAQGNHQLVAERLGRGSEFSVEIASL